jgi:branched-chain amino acid transport system substrate-binding protein
VLAASAQAQGTLKIGEINSYKAQPAFLEPYKKGMELAVDEINAAGGLLGRKVELVIRDDNANPGDAVRAAEELLSREKVDVLMGGFLSQHRPGADRLRQAEEDLLPGRRAADRQDRLGRRQPLHLPPARLHLHAGGHGPRRRGAEEKALGLVYPNYEYGQSAAASFKTLLKAAQPDVEFVAEQAPPLGKVDAGSVVQALADAKPDAIFNVLFAADLTKFVREGNTRGLFKGIEVASLLTGEPEYLDPLKDDAPNGWLVTGYPWYGIKTPEHEAFLKAYQAKFKDYPRLGSVVGYSPSSPSRRVSRRPARPTPKSWWPPSAA